jgi:lipoprotein-anchoring transpeptidase ErfK/SrfK
MKYPFLCALLAAANAVAATPELVVSTTEQRMYILEDGARRASFPVSTSKFGIGDRPRSYCTPLGTLKVTRKVGQGAPTGAVFKALRATGEVLRPNTRGRDPIVTRVLCLGGLDPHTRNAAKRGIYIHGTPEESRIGRPASYGCVRMKSRDIVRLFDAIPVGAKVTITPFTYRQLQGSGVATIKATAEGQKAAVSIRSSTVSVR